MNTESRGGGEGKGRREGAGCGVPYIQGVREGVGGRVIGAGCHASKG